eukprot:5011568-Amphidinium_carterae.1
MSPSMIGYNLFSPLQLDACLIELGTKNRKHKNPDLHLYAIDSQTTRAWPSEEQEVTNFRKFLSPPQHLLTR